MEIQLEGDVSGEESARLDAKRVCACTTIHPSIPSLSISEMMSYINYTTPVDRDVEKGVVF